MNYTELKAEVKDWAHRTDLDLKMDIFTELAEAVINKDLRTREMEVRLPVTFTDTFYDLPADYMEMRALHMEIRGARDPLQQFTPQQLDRMYSRSNSSPRGYTIQGGQIEFRPGIDSTAIPPVTYDGEITYYKRVDTLITNPTTDILTTYPLMYLAAMLIQVYLYIQDDAEMGKWGTIYEAQIAAANKSAEGGRYVTPSVKL